MVLGERYGTAFSYVSELQRLEKRKGTEIPSMTHFLSVSALVMEYGGSEDEAIAALLHDTVEDDGGMEHAEDLKEVFGKTVADIVLGCSDSVSDDKNNKAPWNDRKKNYIAKLATESQSTLLVSCADKLHNVRSVLAEYHIIGGKIWERFIKDSPNPADKRNLTLWYYDELHRAYSQYGDERLVRLVDELGRTLAELKRVSSQPQVHRS
jgi:(p)ppGpp synthase/HD superfamily hydrolase